MHEARLRDAAVGGGVVQRGAPGAVLGVHVSAVRYQLLRSGRK